MPVSAQSRRLVLVCVAAATVSAPARAADVAVPEPPTARTRDLGTFAAREALLGEQVGTARASSRWRAAALYRLAVGSAALGPVARARAVDAGSRALVRALAEERALAGEAARARAERLALAAVEAAERPVGASPLFAAPTSGTVLMRFGVARDRDTGLLVSRAGVRLAATPGQDVRAPAAGVVVSVAVESQGSAVVLDHGAGWTTIVGGLGTLAVAAGQPVAAGGSLGAAASRAGGVSFEVWRGRRPVDPQLLLRRPVPRALAATSSLP